MNYSGRDLRRLALVWKRIGCCPDWHCDERLWHAGLSPNGRQCLVAGFEDSVGIVWDVQKSLVIWRQDGYEPKPGMYPPLAEWVDSEGYVSIDEPTAAGKYRIFGLNTNHAKVTHGRLALNIELQTKTLQVVERSIGEVVAQLKYEADSGDWAFASFSDDGSVIVVLEPHNVTFYDRCS